MSAGKLCFVLMPFGSKPDPSGRPNIDFDRIYAEAIRPAIEAAGLTPIRADEEKAGGVIHKPMFERLLLCEYAVADLTTANANVFYELGVRHTARPRTTQAIFAKLQPIAFDVNYLRALPYDLGPDNEFSDKEAGALREALTKRLKQLRESVVAEAPIDSPLFQLLGEWKPGALATSKTDVFREQVALSEKRKASMAAARAMARAEGLKELERLEKEWGALDIQEAGVVVDLLLSYRALKGWTQMEQLFERMPAELKRQILVREQLAFALNRRAGDAERGVAERRADRQRALEILEDVERQQGPSPETCGLIGRIHKDQWDELRDTQPAAARGHLGKAIDAYLRGFEADLRDAYPGVNAVTLLDIRGDEQSKETRDRFLPVVRFAAEQRMRRRTPDYWDHATMLELAVIASDRSAAVRHLEPTLASVREVWEPETTARNLKLIREARAARNEETAWLKGIIDPLDAAAR